MVGHVTGVVGLVLGILFMHWVIASRVIQARNKRRYRRRWVWFTIFSTMTLAGTFLDPSPPGWYEWNPWLRVAWWSLQSVPNGITLGLFTWILLGRDDDDDGKWRRRLAGLVAKARAPLAWGMPARRPLPA